ncbi:transposase domain-containing protein [Streptomyces antimycoticus]|uniref:transposase domain-containing protein n=1 Tax=Streptomyces antimycoticus TaxID=68175 RepID=UPI0037D226E9
MSRSSAVVERGVPGPGQVESPAGVGSVRAGVLTQGFPPESADEVIAECGRAERWQWLPQARVVVYFVLVMCLFVGRGYEEVARLLTHGLERMGRWKGKAARQAWGRVHPRLMYEAPGGGRLGVAGFGRGG